MFTVKSGEFHERNRPYVAFHANDTLSAPVPVITGSRPIPGVEDMIGEYFCGDARMVIPGLFPVAEDADDAGMILQVPFTQPQLPAPQSSGPSQLAVHMRLQGFFAAIAVHADG